MMDIGMGGEWNGGNPSNSQRKRNVRDVSAEWILMNETTVGEVSSSFSMMISQADAPKLSWRTFIALYLRLYLFHSCVSSTCPFLSDSRNSNLYNSPHCNS